MVDGNFSNNSKKLNFVKKEEKVTVHEYLYK